jgi:3-oxoacyl-[acyl-carrier protein] reductase
MGSHATIGYDLSGRRALVTGGTRGFARAIALGLAYAGANVIACYHNAGLGADSLAIDLKETGGDHRVVQADVGRAEDVARVAAVCREHFGNLDVVVNATDAVAATPFAYLSPDIWRHVVDANLTTAFLVASAVQPLLSKDASIVNIGAAIATRGAGGTAHYAAAKAGLIGLTRALAHEFGPAGTRVNLVSPGPVDPDRVAAVVGFLVSGESAGITGENFIIDGGRG